MTVYRKIVEKIFRDTSFRKKLTIGKTAINVWVSPDSQLKYFFGQFDDELMSVAKHYIQSGDIVFDIGANCGIFGFASQLNGAKRVYFFEPDLFLAKLIEKTVSSNNVFLDSAVLPVALSDTVSCQVFEIAERGRASNSLSNLGRQQKGGVRFSKKIVTRTLDDYELLGSKGCFIKIDVEGAELLVIRGGLKFISAFRPRIFVEVSSETYSSIRDLLVPLGYSDFEVFANNYLFMCNELEIK
jgi:FkbM family methyltransferase